MQRSHKDEIMKKILPIATLVVSLNANAALGPIPIYLNTEYRTDSPVIGSIASTLTFDANDIEATGANTFLDFLATVPSIGLFNATGNTPAVFMRGGESHHTLFLVDGVSINDLSDSNKAISYGLTGIALSDIEKIEIVKGSGSVLYGSSAIAGVVSITTKKGANGKHATVNTKFGTHNSKTYTLSASNGDKDGFIRFNHKKYTTDGIDARTDTNGEKDGLSNVFTQIKVGNEKFDISYLKNRNKAEYDNFDGKDNENLGDRKFSRVAINANKKISDIWKTKLSLAQTTVSRNTGLNATTIGDKFKSTSITLLNDIKIDAALLNVGLSKIDDKNTTDNQKLSSKNLFVNWQKNINSIDINTGARYIKHSKFGNETIYNLGLAKYLNNGIKLTGGYGTAFSAPSIGRLYGWGANPDLQPEKSKSIELGVEKTHYWGLSSIKIFRNKVKDAITWDGGYTGTSPRYFNTGDYLAKGVELSVNANIDSYNINFNHIHSKSKKNNSLTKVRRPSDITNLTLSKQYGKFNSRIQVIRRSSVTTVYDGDRSGYTLLNLSTKYGINDKMQISLNVNNATDKKYSIASFNTETDKTRGDYNQLGRTIEVGLNYKF